jgi:hypothetical protein
MVRAGANINRNIINANNANAKAAHDIYNRNVYERRKDVHLTAAREVPAGPAVRQEELKANNVYVNPQGDVYRRTDTGWETREGNQWKTEKPAEPTHVEPVQPARPSPSPREEHAANNPGAQEHVASKPEGGAPEGDYQVRQRSEARGRENAPPPQHVEPAHAAPSHAPEGRK